MVLVNVFGLDLKEEKKRSESDSQGYGNDFRVTLEALCSGCFAWKIKSFNEKNTISGFMLQTVSGAF